MTNSQFQHPTDEALAAFVDGLLPDSRSIEAHLDQCPECASAVMHAKQVELMSQEGLIPPLTAAEQAAQTAKLKQLLGRSPAAGRKKSNPLPGGGGEVLGLLGWAAAAFGLGDLVGGSHAQSLAGSEEGMAEHAHGDEGTQIESDHDHNSSPDADHDVTNSGDDASIHSEGGQLSFLERVDELLGHDEAGDQIREGEEGDHGLADHGHDFADNNADSAADSLAEHHGADDGGFDDIHFGDHGNHESFDDHHDTDLGVDESDESHGGDGSHDDSGGHDDGGHEHDSF